MGKLENKLNNDDNQIIHFTNSFDNILSIIKNSNLKINYCKEEFYFEDKIASKNAHPMVCFSEQNIKNLSEKQITYGNYGISFLTNWITKNDIQPVIYIDKNSTIAKSVYKLLLERKKMVKGNPLRLPIMTLKGYLKNTFGYNIYFDERNYNFKDENEWRFVPRKNQINNNFISIDRKEYIKDQKKFNSNLIHYPLKFNEEDILNIFVKTEEEKQKLINDYKLNSSIIKISNWK